MFAIRSITLRRLSIVYIISMEAESYCKSKKWTRNALAYTVNLYRDCILRKLERVSSSSCRDGCLVSTNNVSQNIKVYILLEATSSMVLITSSKTSTQTPMLAIIDANTISSTWRLFETHNTGHHCVLLQNIFPEFVFWTKTHTNEHTLQSTFVVFIVMKRLTLKVMVFWLNKLRAILVPIVLCCSESHNYLTLLTINCKPPILK